MDSRPPNRTDDELFFRRIAAICRKGVRKGTVAEGFTDEYVTTLGEAMTEFAEMEIKTPGEGMRMFRLEFANGLEFTDE